MVVVRGWWRGQPDDARSVVEAGCVDLVDRTQGGGTHNAGGTPKGLRFSYVGPGDRLSIGAVLLRLGPPPTVPTTRARILERGRGLAA